jgi:hypothetical protein
MDHHPIVDISSAAGVSAADAPLPKSLEAEPRFPGEDGGQSLAKLAQKDLDTTLQLLAERAQDVTGASGAAIALRRGEHEDMLCRASAGSNAPELGALLSTEYGLSGESVRTRQALRCDDTEIDQRVNRESCRQLGIASVLVMPIVSEQQVLGVFELFSGKAQAFDERDLSALQRLGEMVETAVKHAEAAQRLPALLETSAANVSPVPPEKHTPAEAQQKALETTEQEKVEAEPVPKKPLFWSAALQIQPNPGRATEAGESTAVPAELRNLQKCKACGFPVSQGRTFCVECEEKQWRGRPLP